jgi:hypothetical protein
MQTTISVLSLAVLVLLAGLVVSIRSQLENARQVQAGTQAWLRQVHQELSDSPVEELLSVRPKSLRPPPTRQRRGIRLLALVNGTEIRPVANPALSDPHAAVSDLNHWSCAFYSVGVAVHHGHITTNTSGDVTGWIEDDVHLYPYESINNIEFEPVK